MAHWAKTQAPLLDEVLLIDAKGAAGAAGGMEKFTVTNHLQNVALQR